MSVFTQEQWDASEFITEWANDGFRFKLLSVPRDVIDEDSDEPDAYLLIKLSESTSLRQGAWMMDAAYGRGVDHELKSVDLAGAPEEAIEIIESYCR